MKHRLWLGLAAVLAVAGLIYLAFQPVFTFQALANAGEAGDRDRLASLVDFPAVRDDLKDQLSERIEQAAGKDKGLFGALGSLLGPSVVDQVVDAAVTPEGVAAIVRSGRAPLSDISGRKSALPPPPETAPPPSGGAANFTTPKPKTKFGYTGFDSFKAVTSTKDGEQLGWVLERRGFGWKLAKIELPPA